MKKFFSIVLALVFMLSLGTVAFADEHGPIDPDPVIAEIPKLLELANPGKLNPAETFTFSFTQQAKTVDTNLVKVAILDTMISYDAGEIGTKYGDIDLTAFDNAPVGRYTYDVKEVLPDPLTAGMTYTSRTGTLVVDKEFDLTVKSYLIIGAMGGSIEAGTKFNNFDNKFSAGDLIITKEVTGNLGDKEKLFEVTVTLTAPDEKLVKADLIKLMQGTEVIQGTIIFSAAGIATVVFDLKHNDTFTIVNLPYGVKYTVIETDPGEGYTVSYPDDENIGTIADDEQTAAIVNHKSAEIPTGISLDSLPYILILGLATSGMSVLFFKRRHAF